MYEVRAGAHGVVEGIGEAVADGRYGEGLGVGDGTGQKEDVMDQHRALAVEAHASYQCTTRADVGVPADLGVCPRRRLIGPAGLFDGAFFDFRGILRRGLTDFGFGADQDEGQVVGAVVFPGDLIGLVEGDSVDAGEVVVHFVAAKAV